MKAVPRRVCKINPTTLLIPVPRVAALSRELVQFVENEFATMNDLIAQRLHVRMEPCRRSHTVFVADLGADRHFGFESALHRVD